MTMVLGKFYHVKKYDFEKMCGIVGLLRSVLDNFVGGKLPVDNFGYAELAALVESLIDGQRSEEGLEGSWAVCPDRDSLAEDEVMDFIVFPTCEAAALIAWVLDNQPDLVENPAKAEEVLRKAFAFLAEQKLEGHGMDGHLQTIESLLILVTGGVPRFLEKRPNLAPDFLHLLMSEKEKISSLCCNGQTTTAWGQDLEESYRAILDAF